MNSPDLDELQRFAVEAAGLAPWGWDITTQRVYLSPQWRHLIGEHDAGRDWLMDELLERIHPDDVEGVKIRIEEVLLGFKTRYMAEFRIRSGRGDWLWTEGLGVVTQRDEDGVALRMVGTNSDISTRRRAQEALVTARQAAEDSNRAKSDLLANVSHELRTPLNAIIGLNKLLLQSPMNDEQKNFLHLIDSSAVSLLMLLNDVLDFSKIEAGKLLFENVRFDLHRWAQDTVVPHAVTAEKKGLQVKLSISPELPHTLVGDPGRLRQVVSNLMANAVKFTQRGGISVTIRPSPDQDHVGTEKLRLLLEVRDSGIGIPREKQSAIFEAFTQADASTTRQYGGTGLGLAICAKLVALMDGGISVSSEPGKGSAFRVSVVLSQVDDHEGPHTVPMTAEEMPLTGLKILLAEDNAVNELLMRRMLGQMGCDVEVAHDGEEALQMWRQRDYDLLLMDVQMPKLSGFDATAHIRKMEKRTGAHLPIVALTAHAMVGDREKCIAAGMDAYVSKPVSAEMLTQAMRDALRASAAAAARPQEMLADVDLTTTGSFMAPLVPVASTSPAARAIARLKTSVADHETDGILVSLLELKPLLQARGLDTALTLAGSLEYAARQERWSLLERALPLFLKEAERAA